MKHELAMTLVPIANAAQRFGWEKAMRMIAKLLLERASGTNDTAAFSGSFSPSFPAEGRFESALPD